MLERIAKAAVAALGKDDKAAAKRLVADPQATAPALYVACNRLLGSTWRAWEPETIWHELETHGAAEANYAKVSAVVAACQSAAPWWEWRAFAACADAFSGTPVDVSGLTPPEPTELAAVVPDLHLLYAMSSDADDGQPEWSEEVSAYVAAALSYHGLCCAPKELEFAEERLHRLLSPEGRQTAAKAKQKGAAGTESEDSAPTATAVVREQLKVVEDYVAARQLACAEQLEKL